MHLHQRTVNSEVSCTGIGLHTGKKVTMCIRPLPANSGIRFCRVDHPDSPSIPARLEHVVDTRLATTLGSNGQVVSTVEHLMSAFAGMGIDNALVTLDGPEVPIMDGSAAPFSRMVEAAGRSALPWPALPATLSQPPTAAILLRPRRAQPEPAVRAPRPRPARCSCAASRIASAGSSPRSCGAGRRCEWCR